MDKVRAGAVGAGWMGGTMLRRLSECDDVEVMALLEKNIERGRQILSNLGLPEDILVDDFDKIVSNPDVDAVWIVSPNSLHAPQALAAMSSGKHVFCEKPASTTFDDFCALIDAEKAHPELVTFVDYILNFDSMETHLKEMIAGEIFGDVTQIQVNYRHPVNIAGDKVWKLEKSVMGDAIGMGINHAVSVMVNLMASQGKPIAVYATSQEAKVRGFEAEPIWNILVKFDSGATGFCFGKIDSGNGYDAHHNVFGTKGAFVFESQVDRPQKVRYWSESETGGKWIYPLDLDRCKADGVENLAWPDDATTPDSGNVVEHQTGSCVAHFIDCVKSGTKSPLSFVNSAVVAEIGWAAQISAVTGKEVKLPLDWEMAGKFFGESN